MRVILIVLDSVGAGELPDAAIYGDCGSNTLLNIKKNVPEMKLPNMEKLGLSHINGLEELRNISDTPVGCYGKMAEKSKGKDTTIGHWEIAGLIIENAFPTYPDGFPKKLIKEFESLIGRKTLGNYPASGTKIIEELGDIHVKTGSPIVYTSADSVFQIASHEAVIPIAEQYAICKSARQMLTGEHGVSRVIARPFITKDEKFVRTENRKDFSLEPPSKTILDYIKDEKLPVAAVGKIEDIFAGKGITDSVHTKNNMEGMNETLKFMDSIKEGLIFTNLVDFDMLYGHRNDYIGYANALMEFDNKLPEIIAKLNEDDMLIITSDHGCDPTTQGTDHTREYAPLLVYGKGLMKNINLNVRASFSDISTTVADYLQISADIIGESFLSDVRL